MELLFSTLLVLCCIAFIYAINRVFCFATKPTAFPGIEGLRGFLAVFVVIHHIFIWFTYLKKDVWIKPESNLINHFGGTSVAFFFMITGFLFLHKLMSPTPINWCTFFRNRLLRVYPVYVVSVMLMVMLVFVMTGLDVRESFATLGSTLFHWLSFTYFDSPDINSYANTTQVNAGVFWSLRYEWFFYLSLPALGVLFFNKKAGGLMLFTTVILCCLFFLTNPACKPILLCNFAGGAIAAIVATRTNWLKFMNSIWVTLGIISLLFLNVYAVYNSNNIFSILLQTLVFIPLACGNTLLGLLKLNVIQVMGQISYSIYVLHGLLLFAANEILMDREWVSQLSFNAYILLNISYLFALLVLSFITHKYIELPALNWRKKG